MIGFRPPGHLRGWFGPKKLPELGRSLGSGMREVKNSITGGDREELPRCRLDAPAEAVTAKRQ